MRYRIIQAPDGHYLVVSASLTVVPIDETYATREVAQGEAAWFNRCSQSFVDPPMLRCEDCAMYASCPADQAEREHRGCNLPAAEKAPA